MLKRSLRLTKQKEIDNVFKSGKGSYNNYIGIKAVKNDRDHSRVAIIVGNKVSKKAVVRNKLKRRLSHIIKEYLPYFSENYDMVAVVLPPATQLDFHQLKKKVHGSFKGLGLL